MIIFYKKLKLKLKLISILGRMAYSIECLENSILTLKINNIIVESDEAMIKLIIDRLWEFTESRDLSVWEQKVVDMSPHVIFDFHENNNFEDYETLSAKEICELKLFYEKCPLYFSDIIDSCVGVGLSNLYGGIVGAAQDSIDKVINIIKIMTENNIKIPDVNGYLRFAFKDGWGDSFTKKDAPDYIGE